MTQLIIRATSTVVLILSSVVSQAAVLTGSGLLPIPVPNSTITWVGPAYTSTSAVTLTGDWSAPAASPWVGGDFEVTHATGTLPVSPNVGLFRYDFSNMTNGGGLLPVGTYFWLGDVDAGSGNNEILELQAWDSLGNLLSEWLDEPLFVNGTGISAAAMPAYTWDAGTMTYIFDGNAVPGNPSIGIFMESNQEMAAFNVNKLDTHYNFAINAPEAVPVPAAAWLFGSGLVGLIGTATRRKRTGSINMG